MRASCGRPEGRHYVLRFRRFVFRFSFFVFRFSFFVTAPCRSCQSIEIVNNLAVAQRQLCNDPLRALQNRAGTVDEPDAAFLDPPGCDVGVRSDAQVAERVLPHRAGRVPRGPPNDLVERESEREELAHHVRHVFHAAAHARDVQIGGDDVGQKAFFDGRHRNAPREAGRAVADIEQDAAFSRLPEGRIDLAGCVLLAAQPRVHVRVDVARTQLARDELGERTLGFVGAEVDHHRQRRECAGFDGAFHGNPLGT